MEKKFQRKKEDFICENCGFQVRGDGYTNHCPACLWSKHVDINPGDRKEECQGLMRLVGLELRGRRYFILHRCERCGFEKFNSLRDEDDFQVLLKIQEKD